MSKHHPLVSWSTGKQFALLIIPFLTVTLVLSGCMLGTTISAPTKALLLKWPAFPVADNVLNNFTMAVSDGVLYVNTSTEIFALNATDGHTILWKFIPSFGQPYEAAPLVDGNVVIDAFTLDSVTAFAKKTGHVLWRFPLSDLVSEVPVVSHGVVYLTTFNLGAHTMHAIAINEATGQRIWQQSLGDNGQNNGFSGSGPAVGNGLVFAASIDGNFYALDATTGHTAWTYATGITGSNSSRYATPAILNGMVYFGANQPGAPSTQAGGFFALDISTHQKVWEQTLDVNPEIPILISGSRVYLTSSSMVGAYEGQTGESIWQLNAFLLPVTLANNTIYGITFSANSHLLAIGLDGKAEWQIDPMFASSATSFSSISSSLLYDNGVVYVAWLNGAAKQWSIYAIAVN